MVFLLWLVGLPAIANHITRVRDTQMQACDLLVHSKTHACQIKSIQLKDAVIEDIISFKQTGRWLGLAKGDHELVKLGFSSTET